MRFSFAELIQTLLEKNRSATRPAAAFKKSKDADGKRVILELTSTPLRVQAAGQNQIPSLDAAKAIEDRAKRVKAPRLGQRPRR